MPEFLSSFTTRRRNYGRFGLQGRYVLGEPKLGDIGIDFGFGLDTHTFKVIPSTLFMKSNQKLVAAATYSYAEMACG